MNNQLIPYCRRPDHDEKQEDIYLNINDNITFKQLSEKGVTSEQLLQWSVPIDIAERYEMNNQTSELFYNCSSSWFGSRCQYQFVYDSSLSFTDIVQVSAKSRLINTSNMNITTCYRFLKDCDRGTWSLCLDWRQVCNGKADCMNGVDEELCDRLEMTTCDNIDEYRCHYGGQCIPSIFARDGTISADCLDGSDEAETSFGFPYMKNSGCSDLATFRCEERINRYPFSFPCGNGQFLQDNDLPSNGKRCANGRNREVTLTMLTSFDHIEDVECQQAFRCLLLSNRIYDYSLQYDTIKQYHYFEMTWDTNCTSLINHCGNQLLVLPKYPIMYGYFQFVYLPNRSIEEFKMNVAPDFFCFDAKKCPALLSQIVPIPVIENLTCCRAYDLIGDDKMEHFYMIHRSFKRIYDECSTTGNESSCASTYYFHCNKSLKCISYDRVGDGFYDCYYMEDEEFSTCHLNKSNRFQCTSDPTKCLLPVALGNRNNDCPEKEDESIKSIHQNLHPISIFYICDDLRQVSLTDGNETDETNCERWPCFNPYLHCNMHWNCLNGIDELNCPHTNCSFDKFPCKNNNLNLTYCLPFANMFHKKTDDCALDGFIRQLYFDNGTYSLTKDYYSFNASKCLNEQNICNVQSAAAQINEDICLQNQKHDITIDPDSNVYKIQNGHTYICTLEPIENSRTTVSAQRFFTSARLGFFPSTQHPPSLSIISDNQYTKNISTINTKFLWYCHYGILTLFKGMNQTKLCLCPPGYFGSQCQWQSQRISLTLQCRINTIVSSTFAFQLIIMLIDDHGNIQPNHEQITYIPAYECNTKFNIYLLYPHRPKNVSVSYSIRIDLFDKATLTYWSSWYLSIPFLFLPVNRIATQLIIPETPTTHTCALPCGKHGRCMSYTNLKSSYFCQCDQEYSGAFCNITYQCRCSNNSLCLSPSICVCPLNKFGSHCYLTRSICQPMNNPCQHNGLCIPMDDRINLNAFFCICKDGYQGQRCQYKSNRIDIHIDKKILTNSSTFFIHYIVAFDGLTTHERITSLKKIAFAQNTLTIYAPRLFHVLFIQIPDGDYYLTVLRQQGIPSEYIKTKVTVEQRCFPVNDLFNDTFRQYKYLRQVKYYPLLCRQHSQMMCFYDEYYMCICDLDRFSNCFEFNRTVKNDCRGRKLCSNDGRCFMNNDTCPTTFVCICKDCFYGTNCQFSTESFIFSLDPILGYHIKPNVSLFRQPFIVKLSMAIIIVMLTSQIILGTLCVITFLSKKSREVGCGYYLLVSSISSICMIIVLAIKFCHLILSQMSVVTNRSILQVNCISLEIILKSCLASSEWFHALVAIERMFSVIKGVTFNKRKSIETAKWTNLFVIIVISGSHIHDPLHRKLIDDLDGDQLRIWCFTQYSPFITTYNTFITLFHFLTPFSMNLISASTMIIVAARSRWKVESKISFKQHFLLKMKQHKHIIIAPIILLLLGLPRLIISFTTGCMRSAREPWLHLVGYFISFVPSILIFFVFILPSDTYKIELFNTIRRWIRRWRSVS